MISKEAYLRKKKSLDIRIKQLEEELQKLTDKYIKQVDQMVDEKSKDILTV